MTDRQKAIELWEAAREQVRGGNSDFRGRHFPEDPSIDPSRRGFNFLVFQGEARFEDAVFEGGAYFVRATFEEGAVFNKAVFNDAAYFESANFKKGTSFISTLFKSRAGFVGVTFCDTALFSSASLKQGLFYDSKFLGIAEFGGAQFGMAAFNRVVFESYARIRGVRFREEVTFPSATFMKSATFEDSIFEGKADFSDAQALQSVVFSLPTRNKDKRSFQFPEQGVSAYRFAKRAAKNIGDSRAASEYHYAERCAHEIGSRSCWSSPNFSHLPKSDRFWRVFNGWFEFIFMRLFFGYGEKPLRVALASLFVVILFSFYYWQMACSSASEIQVLNFVDAINISLTTFTTLGYYGDYHPIGLTRIAIAVEAFLGVFLTSIFIVVLGRRYLE